MNRELKKTIREERERYLIHFKTLRSRIREMCTCGEEYEIYRFICALRKAEFYETKKKNLIYKLMYLYYLRESNIYGNRLGYTIYLGVLGEGVRLWHRNIIINEASKVGDGCVFHGSNCIGNNGIDNRCPVLGKNIDIGVGAKIIGGITLADGIRIGANAVVTKSFTEPGITIAGVPAVKVKGRME